MQISRFCPPSLLSALAAGLVAAGTLAALLDFAQRELVLSEEEEALRRAVDLFTEQTREPAAIAADENTPPETRLAARREMQDRVRAADRLTGLRFTVLSAEGRVWADSRAAAEQLDNHSDRPEIRQALQEGQGTARRQSPTLGVAMIYVARPIEQDGQPVAVVRAARESAEIERQLAPLFWLLWPLALLPIAILFATQCWRHNRLERRLSAIFRQVTAFSDQEAGGAKTAGGRDVGRLAAAIDEMQDRVSTRLERLEKETGRLSAVLGGMGEGVLAVDNRQRVILANAAGRRLLQFATEDAVGRPLLEVTRSRPVREAVSQTLHGAASVRLEFEAPPPSRKLLELRSSRLPGEPCPGVVIVLHDVSELRRLENLRRELVANVSHELKTPLAAIKAYAETLRLGAIDDRENRLPFVIRIEEQAERLNQLILDLLQLARVETGQESFEITDVSLTGAARSCCEQHERVAAGKDIAIVLEAAGDDVSVRSDEEALAAILDNLVDNALKYTPAAGQVTIRVRREPGAGVLEVQDTGIGIAPADQQRIFERFYRVDRARSREIGGTGLGLSIVKHLCQALGGSVELESEPGRGSLFRVRLPPA